MGKGDPVFICDECGPVEGALIGRFYVGYIGADGICAWCGRLARNVYDSAVDEPQIGQWGEFEFSTSLELDIVRRIVYDPNGFYRCLGVPTDATREQIRTAYQLLEGWTDDRLTYAVKVLLNTERRARYDALEPGDFWFDPWLRQSIEEEVLRSGNAVAADPDDPNYDPSESVKADLDRREGKPLSEGLDKDSWSDQNLSQPAWGHYVWRTMRVPTYDLAQWRSELALAMREQGVTARIAVGFARGTTTPFVIRPIGHRPVVFLGEGERPTKDLAAEAVKTLHLLGYTTTIDSNQRSGSHECKAIVS